MLLSYETWGAPKELNTESKTTLVFLHGMGGTGQLWRPIAAGLENHFNILAMDQRGHGKSLAPPHEVKDPKKFSPEMMGQDVIDTLRHSHVGHAVFIGHSMGVRTACAVAHLEPERVLGLVIIDLGFSGPAGGGLGSRLSDFLLKLPDQFPNREEAREYLLKKSPDRSMGQYLLAVLAKKTDSKWEFPFQKAALLSAIEAAKGTLIRPWIRAYAEKTKRPVLILRGEKSSVWPSGEFDNERKQFSDLNNVQFETFEGAGHGLPFEKRPEFTQRLERFVNELNLKP